MPDTTTVDTNEPTGETGIQTRVLTINDRCDKCGPSTRAYVRVLLSIEGEEKPLDFCGSCYFRREELLSSLIGDGRVRLIDERQYIEVD